LTESLVAIRCDHQATDEHYTVQKYKVKFILSGLREGFERLTHTIWPLIAPLGRIHSLIIGTPAAINGYAVSQFRPKSAPAKRGHL
jgi:hypothetical protein